MCKTKIPWADEVWNPTVGCTKVSSGCKNCYAERIYGRFHPDEKFSEVKCYPERLEQPLHWKKPRTVFVDSMSDLFHEDVPNSFLPEVWAIMAICRNIHKFQILTKRPERMMDVVNDNNFHDAVGECIDVYSMTIDPCAAHFVDDFFENDGILPNVWLGGSVEDQKTADERIPLLLQTQAAVRFISVEPMLGELNINSYLKSLRVYNGPGMADGISRGIDWVICGCESGPNRRTMELDRARSLRDQCQAAGVPFFLKQAVIDGKFKKMPELDGKVWDEKPK